LGKGFFRLKLVAIDAGGIWVESQDYVNEMLKKTKLQHAPLTPVLFLPFSSIEHLVYLHEAHSISEESLGLED
jgi:hypothetical protein